jgi:hypothetical protein
MSNKEKPGIIYDVERKYVTRCTFWKVDSTMYAISSINGDMRVYIFSNSKGIPGKPESYMYGYTYVGWIEREVEKEVKGEKGENAKLKLQLFVKN